MWELDITEVRLTRRQVVAAGGTAALIAILAAPKDAKRKLAELTGSAPLNEGKIAIDVPPYTQYGKQVRIAVSVDSPMSAGTGSRRYTSWPNEIPCPKWLPTISGRWPVRPGSAPVSALPAPRS